MAKARLGATPQQTAGMNQRANASNRTTANISWEGDSLDVLKGWPRDVQHDFGLSLRNLQEGMSPNLAKRPMQTVGQGVFELKAGDEATWYRVIYLSRIEDTIYVLDSFTKKSRKTEKNDLNRARARLSNVRLRLQKEKIDAKRKRDK
jgi:phage-related protein